ncbi:MAG: hypothetical protein IKK17_04850 [Oscillospiraceae bacterium]|jgi:hypothetical protein|nr:hypothetical protein [Oscillospiraceae bacterium]
MERESLEQIRSLLEGGDTASAVAAMLDTITDLMDEVDTLNVQLETLLDTLGGEEGDGEDFDDTTYLVTCEKCGCVMEIEAWLLEDETAELSCPKCGKDIEM